MQKCNDIRNLKMDDTRKWMDNFSSVAKVNVQMDIVSAIR